jgi:hypothetical protein
MNRGGTGIPISLETVHNGYGENTIAWYPTAANPTVRPSPVAPATDTTVAIHVTNVLINGSPQNFSYQVIIFDPTISSGPSVVSMNPQSGNGVAQTFTFTFDDTAGYANLDVINVLINSSLDGRFGCYIAYDRPSNVLYLMNDNSTALLPGLILNGLGTTSNSYCSIQGAGSSVVGNGSALTLTLNIAFNTVNFAGDKVIYLAARDLTAGNTGWQTRGVWRVPAASGSTLTVASLTPGSGIGSPQTFVVAYHDPTSALNITNAQLLINADLNGNNACYLGYVRTTNLLYLVNDSSPGLQPPITPNSGTGTAQNSQCILNGAGTTVSVSGADLTLTVNLAFKAAFSGPKVAYGAAQTGIGGNTGWQARGVWTVP